MMKKDGFTLIEAIMAITIISIISLTSAGLLMYFTQNIIFTPRKLSVDMTGDDILHIMAEGDAQAKGLRFSTGITSANDTEVRYTDADGRAVRFRLDNADGRVYRYINGIETVIPYYFPAGMTVEGVGNIIFRYYNASENLLVTPVADPAVIRRIEVNLVVRTGTGQYSDWEGRIQLATSVAVRRFI